MAHARRSRPHVTLPEGFRPVSTYVIGDVQGCFAQLEELLAKVRYKRRKDRLWFVGDLINRGPDSLATLRFVRKLGERAVAVLGNHDLHFLAIVFGGHATRPSDTLDELLGASDCLQLAHWLRELPMLHRGEGVVMTHAGIPHIWTLKQAGSHARELEAVLRGDGYRKFFHAMYGNEPSAWSKSLAGMPRHRVITNYFTRMRFVNAAGEMEFEHKGHSDHPPPGFKPWFDFRLRIDRPIVFGHWASLEGVRRQRAIGLDTGCVWGRCLTALRLEDRKLLCVECDGGSE